MNDDRAKTLKHVLGGSVIARMEALRKAVRRFAQWPFSAARQETLMRAWEDVMVEQVNRIQSTTGVVTGILDKHDEQLRHDLDQTEGELIRLEERVTGDEKDAADTRDLIHDLYRYVEEPMTAEERAAGMEEPDPPRWVHPSNEGES